MVGAGSRETGAERLVAALAEQIDAAAMPEGIDEVGVTFACGGLAGHAEDGDEPAQPRRPAPARAQARGDQQVA